MRKQSGNDFVASIGFTPCGVEGSDHREVGPDRGRAGPRLERETVHPADLAEQTFEAPHDLEHSLDGGLVLKWVQVGSLRTANELIVDLWRVLHRAGSLTDIDVEVDPQGLLR